MCERNNVYIHVIAVSISAGSNYCCDLDQVICVGLETFNVVCVCVLESRLVSTCIMFSTFLSPLHPWTQNVYNHVCCNRANQKMLASQARHPSRRPQPVGHRILYVQLYNMIQYLI